MSIKMYVEIARECAVKGKILLEYFMKQNKLADFPIS